MKKLTINVDVDGVLYDFTGAMQEFAETELARVLKPTRSWHIWEAWDITKAEWFELFSRAIHFGDVFLTGQAIPGGVEAIRALWQQGHRLRLVTSKQFPSSNTTASAQVQCIEWLEHHDLLSLVELVFTHNKQGYPADVIVDDKPSLSWAQKGKLNLLFNQPWNADVHLRDIQFHVTRVASWHEVLHQVEMEANPLIMAAEGIPGNDSEVWG